MNILLLLVVLASATVVHSAKVEWSYTENAADGPENWYKLAGYGTCAGKYQSPINFNTKEVIPANMGDLEFKNYKQTPTSMTLINNGHTAQLAFATKNKMTVSGGKLESTYVLEQLHFHWGSDKTRGSEHTIDGRQYPIEMHLVHYLSNYSGVGEAAGTGRPEALAVVGVMFKESPTDNADLEPLIEGLDHVKDSDSRYNLKTTFPLHKVVPKSHGMFYRYHGSLTTPGCNQVVTWTVMERPLKISKAQLDKFRALQGGHHAIVNNYRPVQLHNGRSILRNADVFASGGKSNVVASTLTVLATLTFLSRL